MVIIREAGMRARFKIIRTHLVLAIVTCVSVSAQAQESRSAAPRESRVSQHAVGIQAMATWNIIALRTTNAGPVSPPRESRSLAIVFTAVNDAVCSIVRQCEVYARRVAVRRDASIEAAVDAAAHDALVALYPDPNSVASLNTAYDSALATLPAGKARDAGVTAGQTAAATMLALRANDHSQGPMSYRPSPGVGSWGATPSAFAAALEPEWGLVTPFLLDAGSQLRPPPPPTPGSDAAVRDYLEIQVIGGVNSTTRTAAQTEVAEFWVSTAPQLWNQVVRQLTFSRGMNAAKAARAYMLLNMIGADAVIAAWDAKFAYNQWRPVTAIRGPLDDGNLTTPQDSSWTPLISTPPFPDYPAGHTTFGGAAERVMTVLFGEQPGALSITSPTAGNVTHTYRSFREIADEVGNARVWGGVHWRTSTVAGRELGQRVADVALERLGPDNDAQGRRSIVTP
jgi:hypothetical protein